MRDVFLVHSRIPYAGDDALTGRYLVPRFGARAVQDLERSATAETSRLPYDARARAMRSYAASGPVPFGYFDAIYPNAVYLSALADPVERWLNFAGRVARDRRHWFHAHLAQIGIDPGCGGPDRMALLILADKRSRQVLCNSVCRLASGLALENRQVLTEDHAATALRNLLSPRYLVGQANEPAELIARLSARFGPARDKTTERHADDWPVCSRKDLRPDVIDRIRAANQQDCRLFEALEEKSAAFRNRSDLRLVASPSRIRAASPTSTARPASEPLTVAG
ncbi:MAG: hypothetical protein AAF666_10150 [Pseudomonadota bacterium]